MAPDHPRLRSRPRRRRRHRRRRPPRRAARHHDGRRQRRRSTARPHNALVVRELLGVDVPVHSGAARRSSPSCTPRRPSTASAGSTAPTSRRRRRPLDGTDAVGFIVDTCRRVDGVWIVAVGPLTNVALALRARARPRRARRRDLDHGRRHVRQPLPRRRVQHLGRPRGRGHRVRLRRAARDGRARPDPPAAGDARAHRRRAPPARAPGGDARRPVRRSSPARTSQRHDDIAGAPCTTRAPSSPSPIPSCSSASAATSPSRRPAC